MLDRDTWYAQLDIDSGRDFQYFENLAALLESDDVPEEGLLYGLLEDVDMAVLADLMDSYFEELGEGLPEEETELLSLLEQIRMALKGMAKAVEADENDESALRCLADELDRFHRWFALDSEVVVTPQDGGRDQIQTLRDAAFSARAEKLAGPGYLYDFSRCLDYRLEAYTMSFADLLEAEPAGDRQV